MRCPAYDGKKRCAAYTATKKDCDRWIEPEDIYCLHHDYFKEFTDEFITRIRNGDDKIIPCDRCTHWFEKEGIQKRCKICRELAKQKGIKKRQETVKCKWFDRKNKPCRNNPVSETDYCKFHDYVTDYSDEMKDKSKKCSGCCKIKYFEKNICQTCIDRGAENREKERQKPKTLCLHCHNYQALDDGYCGNHTIEGWKKEEEQKGNRVCIHYIRGCRNMLKPDYKFKTCRPCLDKTKKKDLIDEESSFDKVSELDEKELKLIEALNKPKQNENAKEKENSRLQSELTVKKDQNVSNETDPTIIDVKKCPKCVEDKQIKDFMNPNPLLKDFQHCIDCRIKERQRDSERIGNRDWQKEGCNPTRKLKKKEWRENNQEKVIKYYLDARGRQMQLKGENYWTNNAERAKKYRQNNQEKMLEIYENDKKNPNKKFHYYKYTAEIKGLIWELTFEECLIFFQSACYYCGQRPPKDYLNGIDRKKNDLDYFSFNVVPCCSVCNYIKKCLDDTVLIKRCEHILTNLKMIEGRMDPSLFGNHFAKFKKYITRASEKNIKFELTPEQFEEICRQQCYICGKANSNNNQNGIDRYYNDRRSGYTLENARPCCGECNYMKDDLEYNNFINKLRQIYNFHHNFQVDNNDFDDLMIKAKGLEYYKNWRTSHNKRPFNRCIVDEKRGKKISREEKQNRLKEKRKKAKIEMKRKYNNEEYKNQKVKEIISNRQR